MSGWGRRMQVLNLESLAQSKLVVRIIGWRSVHLFNDEAFPLENALEF